MCHFKVKHWVFFFITTLYTNIRIPRQQARVCDDFRHDFVCPPIMWPLDGNTVSSHPKKKYEFPLSLDDIIWHMYKNN